MSTPYLSEIRIMSFSFPPKGWALCDGQLMPINQNTALFSLIGTYYGGDGVTNFALPNLQARVPLHMGNGFALGQPGGEQSHTLSIAELPAHTHSVQASSTTTGKGIDPAGKYLGGGKNVYSSATNLTAIAPGTLSGVGGNQPHLNMQPFLTLSFCIALLGIYPSRS